MPDRDMIIRGCEYWIKNHKGEQLILEYAAVEDLLTLLKEQEAVEPKKENDGTPEPWTMWWYVCGDCGQPIDKIDRYCRGCGKQVKWE